MLSFQHMAHRGERTWKTLNCLGSKMICLFTQSPMGSTSHTASSYFQSSWSLPKCWRMKGDQKWKALGMSIASTNGQTCTLWSRFFHCTMFKIVSDCQVCRLQQVLLLQGQWTHHEPKALSSRSTRGAKALSSPASRSTMPSLSYLKSEIHFCCTNLATKTTVTREGHFNSPESLIARRISFWWGKYFNQSLDINSQMLRNHVLDKQSWI